MASQINFRIEDALSRAYRALEPWSHIYRFDFRRFLNSLKIIEREAGPLRGKKVLDLGSGIGIILKTLEFCGCDASGVDKFIFASERANIYSVKDFDKLQKIWEAEQIRVFKSDITLEALPFQDKSFDIVISDATIEHLVQSPRHLFAEAKRVLKPGGYFLVTTPNLAALWKRARFFFLGRSPNWDLSDYFKNSSNFRGHRREFTSPELKKMLEWSGFDVCLIETKNVFLNEKRLFSSNPQKMISQIFELLSLPFPNARDTIYALARATGEK